MIKELRLTNWKSFEGATLYVDPLTILIGTNASGKSNVLEALLFLKQVAEGAHLNTSMTEDGKFFGVRGGQDLITTNGASFTKLELVMDSNTNTNIEYSYSISFESTPIDGIKISEESLSWRDSALENKTFNPIFLAKKTDIPKNGHAEVIFDGISNKPEWEWVVPTYRSILSSIIATNANLREESKTGIQEVIAIITQIHILDPIPANMRGYSPLARSLKPDASNIAGVLAALDEIRKNEVEAVLTSYLKRLPERDIIQVGTRKVGLNNTDAMLYCEEHWKQNESYNVDARGMSDGTLRFLAIMTAVLTIPEKSLLVIEEIDNGFHPSRAKLLIEFLKEIGVKRNVDVVCTTHNPAFLDALGNDMIVFISVVHRDNDTGASTITLLEDIEALPRLLARGSVGDITTEGLLEQVIQK